MGIALTRRAEVGQGSKMKAQTKPLVEFLCCRETKYPGACLSPSYTYLL